MIISFEVVGLPKAQPRARAVNRGKHAGVYTPDSANGWKEAVKAAAIKEIGKTYNHQVGGFRALDLQPLKLQIIISLPAPKGWRTPTGKPAKKCPKETILDWGAHDLAQTNSERTVYPDCQKPDWDNLGKSTCDALNDCGFWHDDAQCHDVHVIRWRSFDPPGAIITVETL